ncbi:Imm1 family immunity protein [Actinokineospora pegani]|uniref:Imm1 family immunity protein n=1 Tax=Actinokineospora pegani TaxID=2654637 RepID=UPI0012EA4437
MANGGKVTVAVWSRRRSAQAMLGRAVAGSSRAEVTGGGLARRGPAHPDRGRVRSPAGARHLSEVAADTEVPIDVVRRGPHEFLATGTRPSVVHEDA